jgi:hypothetical protein
MIYGMFPTGKKQTLLLFLILHFYRLNLNFFNIFSPSKNYTNRVRK